MWWQPLLLSLELMAVSVVIAGMIGVLGAWAASSIQSSGPVGRGIARIFLVAMVAAIAMPMILHAASWEATAGKFGWLPLTQTGSRSTSLGAFGAFGGLIASGWIHGLFGSAIVALATWHGVKGVAPSVIAQSRLDAEPISVWWQIRLPLAAPWVVIALLGTAALGATEMTVVDLYGLRTVADEFYLFYATEPSLVAILVTTFLPLAVASALLVTMLAWRSRFPAFGRNELAEPMIAEPLPRHWLCLASVVALIVASIVVLIPVAGLLIKTGHQVTVDGGTRSVSWSLKQCLETLASAPVTFASEYRWTALLSLLTGGVAVIVAWIPAAIGRTHRKASGWFDLATILLVLLPGPMVGLAVVQLFQFGVPGFRTVYQQTLIPTIFALLFRAGPVAYWVLRAGYRGIDDAVFDSARIELSRLGRFWRVDRPLLKRSLVAAFFCSAVVASGDVPATLKVAPPGVTTVGTRLFELLHSGARHQEAGLALWYVAAIVVIASVMVSCSDAARRKST